MGQPDPDPPPLYTIGYEGASLEGLTTALLEHGVRTVVDVRELPLSRRAGFSKTPLSAALALNGVAYAHERELGTPRALRHAHFAGLSAADFREAYLAVLEGRRDALGRLAARAAAEPVAILCFERDPFACHRSFIAEELLRLGLVREVVHLVPER
jgi:uncharacterized protein (DUF488 family)